MKRLNKKGFTIVELVIVIAVIAILAAVLIPTFSGVVDKANKSAALQESKNAYTNYVIAYAENGTYDNNVIIVSGNYYFVVTDGVIDDTANAYTSSTKVNHGGQDYSFVTTATDAATIATGTTNYELVPNANEAKVYNFKAIAGTKQVAVQEVSDTCEGDLGTVTVKFVNATSDGGFTLTYDGGYYNLDGKITIAGTEYTLSSDGDYVSTITNYVYFTSDLDVLEANLDVEIEEEGDDSKKMTYNGDNLCWECQGLELDDGNTYTITITYSAD